MYWHFCSGPAPNAAPCRIYSERMALRVRVTRCACACLSKTARQPSLMWLLFVTRHWSTSSRFGIASQHTLNASLMQACLSSAVSATAAGHKNATSETAAIGKNILIELPVCLFCLARHSHVHRLVGSVVPARYVDFCCWDTTKRSQPLQVWLTARSATAPSQASPRSLETHHMDSFARTL